MCEVMEKFYNEGKVDTVKKLLESNKISFEDLSEALEITPEELNQLIKKTKCIDSIRKKQRDSNRSLCFVFRQKKYVILTL